MRLGGGLASGGGSYTPGTTPPSGSAPSSASSSGTTAQYQSPSTPLDTSGSPGSTSTKATPSPADNKVTGIQVRKTKNGVKVRAKVHNTGGKWGNISVTFAIGGHTVAGSESVDQKPGNESWTMWKHVSASKLAKMGISGSTSVVARGNGTSASTRHTFPVSKATPTKPGSSGSSGGLLGGGSTAALGVGALVVLGIALYAGGDL